MAERVVPVELDVRWQVSVPNAILLSNDSGHTVLALEPDADDSDQRSVVLSWEGVRYASMGNPNDEALEGHPLYAKGLDKIHGIGLVEDSALVAALERQNSVHPFHDPEWFADMRHHVLPLKEVTVEVVAASLSVVRVRGTTAQAALSAVTAEVEPMEPTVV